MASHEDDLSPRPDRPALVRVARRLAAGAMIASATLGACGGDDDGAADAGMDAIIGPMPPPLDAGMDEDAGEEDAGMDAEIIGPMPPPRDAGDDEDAGMDAGPIGPMPDAGPIPPMPPPEE